MEFKDFYLGLSFWTATGRWIVIDIDPEGTSPDWELKTPIVYAIPALPNQNLTAIDDEGRPLTMEFYEWDFGGCDLEDRFS